MQSLALTHLLFGAVVFGCLADVSFNLGDTSTQQHVWYEAEVLLRNMLRWALKSARNMRSSFLYLLCNCPTI
jgi:hypothetical protein